MGQNSLTKQDRKRSVDNSSAGGGKKRVKIEIQPLNPMVFYPGFPHIAEKIFDQLDRGCLRNCREVSKSWLESIDNRNLLWNEIVKDEGGNKAFLFACKNGHSKMLEMLFQKFTEFNIDFNAQGKFGRTAFHLVCQKGPSNVAEMFLQKSAELNIKLNEKEFSGKTGFHLACSHGQSNIAEMLIKKSRELKIKLDN